MTHADLTTDAREEDAQQKGAQQEDARPENARPEDVRPDTVRPEDARREAVGDGSVVVEDGGALLFVRLDRPAKRNALTRLMLERLREIFSGLKAREDLRAVILTAAGDVAFCAGTDIGELFGLDEAGARETSRRGQEACDAIELCGVPVIAALNGVAAGGGCELALACHLRVAARPPRLSLPEARLGVIPAYGGTQRLARAIGSGRALALMLAGEEFTADEALRLGLFNRVAEKGQLMAEAESLARSIIDNAAPLAARACLEAVTRGTRLSLDEGLRLEADLFSRLFSTEDVREGTRAFLEKRKPVFKGR